MKGETVQWRKLLLDASVRVQRATDTLLSGGGRRKRVGTGASGDVTLLADQKAEEALISALSKVKGLRVLSEEVGEVGERGARLLAVLDPVDGSSNFERGIPFYCTSVAIVMGERLDGLEAGLVRNLVTGDVYYAEPGRGAFKNGRRIRTSSTSRLQDAVLGVDMSRTDGKVIESLVPLMTAIKRQVHYGANALELCFLAEGMTDGLVDIRGRMRVVDFAASYLIAKEAGAVITSESGSKLDPDLNLKSRFGFVASANHALHELVLQQIKR